MYYKKWLNESSISDLQVGTELAFPNTTLRQHATQPVIIKNISWNAYRGLKTLFVKALAQNEDREYNPIILFKEISYQDFDGEISYDWDTGIASGKNAVKIMTNIGRPYALNKISLENNNVNLRCNCPDFRWRFSYYNHVDESLYGRKPAKYHAMITNRPPVNPLELPGMCKHLIKFVEVLEKAGIFV